VSDTGQLIEGLWRFELALIDPLDVKFHTIASSIDVADVTTL
jgi:hypothetical protein